MTLKLEDCGSGGGDEERVGGDEERVGGIDCTG